LYDADTPPEVSLDISRLPANIGDVKAAVCRYWRDISRE
jgi:hypothetical protein